MNGAIGMATGDSSSDDDDGVEDMTPKYLTPVTPHGELVRVVENVYMVRGSYVVLFGVRIPRTMCIVKEKDKKGRKGGVTIVNAIRVDEKVLSQINIMGPVRNLVRLGHYGGCDDYFYLKTYRHCRYWTLKKEKPFNGGIRKQIDKKHKFELKEGPGGCPLEEGRVVVMKHIKFPEAMIWIPNGNGTLIACDALQNNVVPPPPLTPEEEAARAEAAKKATPAQIQLAKQKKNLEEDHANVGGRAYLRVNNAYQPNTCLPFYYRPQTNHPTGDKIYKNFQRILSPEFPNFETLITAHGPPEIGEAKVIVGSELAKIWPEHITVPDSESDDSDDSDDDDDE